MTNRPDEQVAEARAAMLELYGAEGHLWDWFIEPDVLPFALDVDRARIQRALFNVVIFGMRVMNALALGYWV